MRANFKREIDSVGEIHDFVRSFFTREGIDNNHLHDVDLVVEELFTNVVKYGRGGDSEIEIELGRQDDRLTIRLTDHDADPFDITTQAKEVDTTEPLEERSIGGLGIHLVKELMDEIDYSYEDRRSTITLVKRIKTQHV
jgi:anti-sigma regulatory factor (Ser/Thr protein kinase)